MGVGSKDMRSVLLDGPLANALTAAGIASVGVPTVNKTADDTGDV